MTIIPNKLNVYNMLQANVLDDDNDMNEKLKEMFDRSGIPQVRFFTESEVFVNAMNENIHLCIIDQVIKGSFLQGIEVALIVKNKFPQCKIVFVTGTSDPTILKAIIKLRPDGFVDKNEGNGDYSVSLIAVAQEQLADIVNNLTFANILGKYQTEHER